MTQLFLCCSCLPLLSGISLYLAMMKSYVSCPGLTSKNYDRNSGSTVFYWHDGDALTKSANPADSDVTTAVNVVSANTWKKQSEQCAASRAFFFLLSGTSASKAEVVCYILEPAVIWSNARKIIPKKCQLVNGWYRPWLVICLRSAMINASVLSSTTLEPNQNAKRRLQGTIHPPSQLHIKEGFVYKLECLLCIIVDSTKNILIYIPW